MYKHLCVERAQARKNRVDLIVLQRARTHLYEKEKKKKKKKRIATRQCEGHLKLASLSGDHERIGEHAIYLKVSTLDDDEEELRADDNRSRYIRRRGSFSVGVGDDTQLGIASCHMRIAGILTTRASICSLPDRLSSIASLNSWLLQRNSSLALFVVRLGQRSAHMTWVSFRMPGSFDWHRTRMYLSFKEKREKKKIRI